MTIRVVSYGGGVQSTALLVLAAEGKIDFTTFLFANTGDDSEDERTLTFVRDVAAPWAAQRGVAVHELRRQKRDGTAETLYQQVMRENTPSIPLYMAPTGMPASRSCTNHFKLKVIERWLRDHGATRADPAVTAVGFSTDEVHRVGRVTRDDQALDRPVFPLLDLGLSRRDCERLIEDAGLPVPPKSACWFCPFHRLATWRDRKRDRPELFDRAVTMERSINAKRNESGRNRFFLTSSLRPLDEVCEGVQGSLFDGPVTCDEGACWT